MKERKHSKMSREKAWLLLVSLLFIIGLLLPGGPVGADDPTPTPRPEEPTEWSTVTATTAEVALNVERLSKGNPKLGSSLNQLLEARCREGLAEAQAFATTHMMVLDDDRVQVVIVTTREAISNLKEAVETLGGEYQGHYETLLQALVPIDALESLAQRPDVQVVREPRRLVPLGPTMAGTVDTEGLGPSNASAWHSAGFTGSGARVAVIDGGFTGYSGLLGTDLPGSVTTYDWTGTGMSGDLHGTACAEVVYDMAPGITMDLHKVSTVVDLGNAVSQAIADGVDIISMSGGYVTDGPGDGTGNLASIVNNARSNGIFFAVAAGNDAEVSWSGQYDDFPSVPGTHQWASGQNINFFGPGDGSMDVIPAGYPIQCGLHWDDWTGAGEDYNLELHYWTGSSWSLVAGSWNDQAGGYPTPEEGFSVAAPFTGSYGVMVVRSSATRDVCLSLSCPFPKGSHLDEWVPERSLSFPADSPDAITVGAVDVSSYNLEPYSSRGPTFGSGGTCSGGSTKPDIAAYANVSTVSYGVGVFNGTSAATPHVAGMAALVKGTSPSSNVDSLQNYLENSAIDLGTAGKDNLYGSGRLYLGDPPICFYDGFESGSLGTDWTTYTTDDGRVQVSSSYPYAGTYSVLLDDSISNSTDSGAGVQVTTDLSGQSQVDLNFWWREFNDENDPEDGVWLSDDGINWCHVFSFNDGPNSYRHDVIDIDAEAATCGLTLNDQFRISFFFYDNNPIPSDGYAIDEVLLFCDNPPREVGSTYLPLILKNSP